MVRKRPATISTTPTDDRGRLGNRASPQRGFVNNNNNNQRPNDGRDKDNHRSNFAPSPKTRARTASSNPTRDDALLPYIVPVRKLVPLPQQKQQPPQQQQQRVQRTPSRRARGSAVEASAAAVAAAVPAAGPRNSQADRVALEAVVVEARAAPVFKAVASPRRPSKSPAQRTGGELNDKQPHPYRRKVLVSQNSGSLETKGSNDVSKGGITQRTNKTAQPAAAPPPAAAVQKFGSRRMADEVAAEVDEVELSAEDTLLLCGVQPGSSKAVWYASMLSQLDTRPPGSTSLFSAGEDGSSASAGSSRPTGRRTTALTPSSSSETRPFTSPVARSAAASFLSGPLQLPAELLLEASWTNGSDRAASAPAKAPALLPSVSATAPLAAVRASATAPPPPPFAPSSPSSSTPTQKASDAGHREASEDDTTSDESGDDDVVEDSSEAESAGAEEDTSEVDSGDDEEDSEESDVEEEREEPYSASPTKFGHGTKKPVSEAADLLAMLRVAVANRRATLPPLDAVDAHLRQLRPSRTQLEEYRVHVLSLEQQAEEA